MTTNRILFAICLSLTIQIIPVSGFSQHNNCIGAGVYLTYDDFVNNKLSNTVNFNQQGSKFKYAFPNWYPKVKIKIVTPDTTKYWQRSVIKFKPGSIYGYYRYGRKYRYAEGKGFFSPYGYFEIIKEMKGLIVYKQYTQHHHRSDYHYYYSIDFKSAIKAMNKKNLIADTNNFNNAKFIESVTLIKNKWVNNNKTILEALISAYQQSMN
ncbi:MAG: hypothetical protein Q7W13_00230 [Bacteroidia bacterium]|nr:hypothetical protein [Bacteroidia bacterium]